MSDLPSTTLEVRVRPKAERRDVQIGPDGRVRVMVTEAPEAGKANAAVELLVAERLGIPMRDVRVIRGAKSRDKVLEIAGFDRVAALARLSLA